MWHRLLALVVVAAALGCGSKKPSPGGEIKVAAASDLARAFEEVGKAFQDDTGIKPVFTFGSTGLLAKQITEGAPYDLFAAANVSFADDVVKAGACDGASQALYARGRIVLWSSAATPARLEDLTDPRYGKIAIANPDHAPYGRAAKEALEKVGVWDAVKPRLVYGENILQTMQYAKSGNADVAIVALSLAVVADGGTSSPIDPDLHAPLDQALVVCTGGANTAGARTFAAFVASPRGREIMTRYGFVMPGEAVPSPRATDTGGTKQGPPIAEADVRALVDAWAAAQNGDDLAAYEALYADRFSGIKRVGARAWQFDRKGWIADRKRMFDAKAPMQVGVEQVRVTTGGAMATVRLHQTYRQGTFKDAGDKQLVVVRTPDGLRIAREEMLQSTVIEGPRSAKATGFAVIQDDRAWLVVGDGAVAARRGPATRAGAEGTGYAYGVRAEALELGTAWTELVGKPVTVYPSGRTCTIAGFHVVDVLTPHFGTEQAWDEDGGADTPTPQDIASAGASSYLAADISGCKGEGAVVGVIGAAAPAWKEIDDEPAERRALAAFEALPAYRELQADYETHYGGKGPWIEAGDEVGGLSTAAWTSPDGAATYVTVSATAGHGCGDFYGGLLAVFRVGDGGALTPVGTVSIDPWDDVPSTLVDTNRDGVPELAGLAGLHAFDGKAYQPVYELDLGYRDSPC